ncbi:Alpha/Beta hydrolase protein [Aspergillus bertholletiae]|uniref:Alpha/Beta hydrolase protein n=1 Tax=Aspergillus bertholletiae TaxID=1226010 RepID=A0A5N7B521_9EURO|nr:Alpha/Beta hydrolase protein [Aspergillus bertholletiae]
MSIPYHPKLEGFDIVQATYKQIGEHAIRVDILIPQTPHTGKRPILVRTHGGALVAGDSLFMDFFPHWASDVARKHGAVVVSPNYRLMPESRSSEIYDDIDDFWKWLHSPALVDLLANHTAPTEIDLTRILTTGDSAGGLLSIYLALTYPSQIRASTAGYPWVNPSSQSFQAPRKILPFGVHTPESIIHDTVAAAASGSIVSSDYSPSRVGFMLAAVEHGRLAGFYERQTEASSSKELFYPAKKLEEPGLSIPKGGIAVWHGRQDTVVPLEDVEGFMVRLREATKGLPGSDRVVLALQDGDHGFDMDSRYEDEWLQEAIKSAVETWLE